MLAAGRLRRMQSRKRALPPAVAPLAVPVNIPVEVDRVGRRLLDAIKAAPDASLAVVGEMAPEMLARSLPLAKAVQAWADVDTAIKRKAPMLGVSLLLKRVEALLDDAEAK